MIRTNQTSETSQEKINFMFPEKNAEGLYIDEKGQIITFRFLYMKDGSISVGVGFDSEPAICPHCGAEGRWIYYWIENGEKKAAMSGCFDKLTKSINASEKDKYFILLANKQVKNKPLNSWDRNIVRLINFKQDGKYPAEWCDKKIDEVLTERKQYLAKNYRR